MRKIICKYVRIALIFKVSKTFAFVYFYVMRALILYYRMKNDNDYVFQKFRASEDKNLSWSIDNLHKYTRYEFVVQAYNSLGSGPLSREVHAVTHEDG